MQTQMKNTNRRIFRRDRRGVTLLFVVSLIVLFLLMGTAFVVVSNNYRKDAVRRSYVELKRDRPEDLLDRTLYTLLRGPVVTDHTSQMRGHSILADQYGLVDGFTTQTTGTITAVPGTDGQFWTVTLLGHPTARRLYPLIGVDADADGVDDAIDPDATLGPDNVPVGGDGYDDRFEVTFNDYEHNGKLLSFTSGAGTGISTRIISQTGNSFVVSTVFGDDAGALSGVVSGDRIVINGRDFAGYGIGQAPGALGPDMSGSPNQVYTGNSRIGMGAAPVAQDPFVAYNLSGGPNEAYDALDEQNMFLGGFTENFDFNNVVEGEIVASFDDAHRDNVAGNSVATSFRPSVANETASNDFVFGAGLDIDSTGDGYLDSILMDVGLPIQTDGNGRRVKPLAAIRVLDLDGRVNVNVNGSLTQINDQITTALQDRGGFLASPGMNMPDIPAGGGYGPAEITLNNSLPNSFGAVITQRYGTDGLPGSSLRDEWSQQKMFGHPRGAFAIESGATGYLFQSSAMDLHGRTRLGVPAPADASSVFASANYPAFPNGLPIMDMDISASADEALNSPYEIDLFGATGADAPYTPLELVSVLRRRDIDSFLGSQRLLNLLGGDAGVAANRITTESWEVPVPPQSVVRLLRDRLLDAGFTGDITTELELMLAPEVLKGLKMNVNREFGNGLDDDGDGTVDEPDEFAVVQNFEVDDQHANHAAASLGFDGDGDPLNDDVMPINVNAAVAPPTAGGYLVGDYYRARFEFAKHLYVLVLLTTDDGANADMDEDGTSGDPADIAAYRQAVARWCATVIDVRDPDVTRTPFEFDMNPWNGWQTDGDLVTVETDRGIVWGSERPELLITEAVSTHDRATENLAAIGGGEWDEPVPPDTPDDNDLDQRVAPRAATFIELYNPWTQNRKNQVLTGSLYRNGGVDLDRVVGGTPVWRLRAFRETGAAPSITLKPLRSIYFVNPNNALDDQAPDPIAGVVDENVVEQFYSDVASHPIEPGYHAVIGGGFDQGDGSYLFPFGRLLNKTQADETAGNLELDLTRHIRFTPDAATLANNEVERFEPGAGLAINPTLAIPVVVNQPRRLNLSDIFNGYQSLGAFTAIDDGIVFTTPFDRPQDFPRAAAKDPNRTRNDIRAIWTNGTTHNFREVHLQRLADPTRAWDRVSNPYLTVDKLHSDLYAYNGMVNDPNNDNQDAGGDTIDPALGQIPAQAIVVRGTEFLTKERGGDQSADTDDGFRSIWNRHEPPANTANGAAADATHNFAIRFDESLGRVNDAYDPTSVVPTASAFPWLNWNNRPFTSHFELMNVPFVDVGELPDEFTMDGLNNAGATDEYISNHPRSPRFRHLLGFFSQQSNLHQVMDYLEVPSRYVGMEKYLTPATFAGTASAAPHNAIRNFRVPGKINLNTIYSQEIWDDLMGAYGVAGDGVSWMDFQTSRETNGFNVGNGNIANSLFRQDAAGNNPLFDFDPAMQLRAHDTDRNAAFRYHMRQRLANMTTTRSSVFAVWVTVCYFEVVDEDITGDGALEYGLVGAEVGADEGKIQRDRAFYLIDRSIPVAFEPGKNHNVDRAILIRQMIK